MTGTSGHSDQIDPPPAFGVQVRTDFILGMSKVGQKVVILLDIEKVLSTDEVAVLEAA